MDLCWRPLCSLPQTQFHQVMNWLLGLGLGWGRGKEVEGVQKEEDEVRREGMREE